MVTETEFVTVWDEYVTRVRCLAAFAEVQPVVLEVWTRALAAW